MKFLKDHILSYLAIAGSITAAALLCAGLFSQMIAVSEAAVSPVVIVLDAGHGGEDGGAVSPNGTQESRLNLEVALRLNDLFHLLGKETRMIRTEDAAVYTDEAKTVAEKKVSDLKNRVRIVNETPSALLVSIHQNMFEDPRYCGAQVFYAPTVGSKALAERTQENLAAFVDPNNHRQVKKADTVYLMNNIRCPGVLVECGFLSNPKECRLLCDAGYQKRLSLAIAGTVTNYLEEAHQDEV